jgi:molybdopterin molybdotransferase
MDGRPVMCLPGNPVAAFVCYRLAAAPVLRRMAGGAERPALKLRVRSGFAHRKSAGRAEYLRVRIVAGTDGEPEMVLHGRKGAGVLSSLTGADGLIEIPVDNEGVAVGDYFPFIPFRETGL